MRNDSPFWQGYNAAQAGDPSSVNSFPKPDRLPGGSEYPGPWSNWHSGWCLYSEIKMRDTTAERAEMDRLTMESLK